jgi:hypothetical protein
MTNGRLQVFTTIITAAFVIGTIWNRISSNAASMRAAIEEIRLEQRELKKQIETLVRKP